MHFFTCALVGALLTGAASAVFGLTSGTVELSLAESCGMLVYGAGRAVPAGLVFGILCALIARSTRRERRGDVGFLLAWAFLSAGLLYCTWDLFDGARISQHPRVGQMKLGLRYGLPLIAGVGLWLARRWLLRHCAVGITSKRVFLAGLAAVGAALFLVRSDVYLFPGLYPGLHALMAGLALTLATLGFCLLRSRGNVQVQQCGRADILLLLGTVVILVGALLLQRSGAFEGARASATGFTRASAAYRLITEPLFGLFTTQRSASSADVSALLEAQRQSGSQNFGAALDALLPRRRSMNVLLVAMDTVRFDHTGMGGYSRATTPNLDRFAQSAYVFPRAYTPYPTSNYAYNALLTGLAAGASPLHGHRSQFDWQWPEEIYYPKLLSKHGVKSTGIAAFEKKDRVNERFFGYVEKGFDVFNAEQTFDRPMTGEEIRDSALRAIAQHGGKPFFMFVHWLDPHDPYEARAGFDFGTATTDRYDSEIAWTDAQFGKLLEALEREGLADNTIVAAFSDHGEALGDHGLTTHNSSLFECEVHVPLVLRVPGLPGGRVDSTVSLVDVMPTVLALRGTTDTQPRMGTSLVPWLLEPGKHPERMAFSEQFTVRQGDDYLESRCIVHDYWKLIEAVERPESTFRLFDLRADPAEARNLFTDPAAAEKRATMLGLLKAAVEARNNYKGDAKANDPAAALATETRQQLAELRSADSVVSRAAGNALRNAMKSRYSDLSERHARLDKTLLTEIRETAEAALRSDLARPRTELIEVLQVLQDTASTPLWLELLAGANPRLKAEAAMALAQLGNPVGRDVLRATVAALNDPILAFPAVLALANIGDQPPIENYAPILRGDSTPESAPLLLALTAARNGVGLKILYERLLLNSLHDFKLKSRAVDYALAAGGPWAAPVLAWLVDDADSGLRAKALTALKTVKGDSAAAYLARTRLEREALAAQLNGKATLAEKQYADYIARYADAEARIYLGLARAKLETGDRAGLRSALEAMQRCGDAEEQTAAGRMLAHIDELKWFFQPAAGEWDAEITPLEVPAQLTRNRSYWLRAKLTNRSKVYWPGGCWVFAPELRTDIVDASGALFRVDSRGAGISRREISNFLPLTGVEPGESIEVLLTGHVPSGMWDNGRLVVGFHQHGTTHIPQSGRWIWTSPDPVKPR